MIQRDAETVPAYGAMFCIDDIIRANRASGGHYFDADTMRFFGSRVLDTVVGGRFFVTSERRGFGAGSGRAYSVREMMPDGTIQTVGAFGGHDSARAARAAAKRAARERQTYYFDGRHGRGGRRVTYVVDAGDPWAALDTLHANFRVIHCGHAADYMLDDAGRYPRKVAS